MSNTVERESLHDLSENTRNLMNVLKTDDCRNAICTAMMEYPDAAEPHNLYGILMEKLGNHVAAMKHFRAAADLDPTFLPARRNMENFGSFNKEPGFVYTEEDCAEKKNRERFKVQYDENGVGRTVRRGAHEYF